MPLRSINGRARNVRLAGVYLVASLATSGLARAADGGEEPTLIGAGWRSRPAYEGGTSRTGELMPVLRVERDPWFIRTTQGKLEGGLRYVFSRAFSVGGLLLHEEGRVTDESEFLRTRGIPNLAPGPAIGYFAEYDWKLGSVPLNTLARYRCRWHFDRSRGAQVDVRMSAGLVDKGFLTATAFGQLTLADRQEMRGYFGVSQELSASSGLAAHTADPGPRFASVGVQGAYALGGGVMLVASAEIHRLLGDAAASPLVERKTNAHVGIGIAWRI